MGDEVWLFDENNQILEEVCENLWGRWKNVKAYKVKSWELMKVILFEKMKKVGGWIEISEWGVEKM